MPRNGGTETAVENWEGDACGSAVNSSVLNTSSSVPLAEEAEDKPNPLLSEVAGGVLGLAQLLSRGQGGRLIHPAGHVSQRADEACRHDAEGGVSAAPRGPPRFHRQHEPMNSVLHGKTARKPAQHRVDARETQRVSCRPHCPGPR